MKAFYSTYAVKQFPKKDKVNLSGTETYSISESPEDQIEVDTLKSVMDSFCKSKFLSYKPDAKSTYYIEFQCDVLKSGKVKKIETWDMRKYTQAEMDFVEGLLKADQKIMSKYERQELEPEELENV